MLGILAVGAAVLLVNQVGFATVEPPTLTWLDPGGSVDTLYYKLTNDTATKYINVTITDKTDGNLTLQYWGERNGTVHNLGTLWQNENRSDLNLTGFMSYLWVTSFDLELKIGWSNYTKSAELTDAVVYENATRSFHYDRQWMA